MVKGFVTNWKTDEGALTTDEVKESVSKLVAALAPDKAGLIDFEESCEFK